MTNTPPPSPEDPTPSTPPPASPRNPGWRGRLWLMLMSRTSLVVGSILLIGLLGGVGYAWLFVTRRLAPIVQENLSQTLKRPVRLGKVESFSLNTLRFAASSIPATAADPDRASVAAVEVEFDPLQLLINRTLELNITLVDPQAYIEENEKGQWLSTAIEQREEAGPITTRLQSIRVQNAQVLLSPYPEAIATPTNTVPSLTPAPNQRLTIEFRQVNGRARFFDDNRRITFETSGQSAKAGNFRLSGEHLRPDARTSLEVQGRELLAFEVDQLVSLPLDLSAGRLDAALKVVSLPDQPVALSGTATLQGVTAQVKGVPRPFTNANGQLQFQGRLISTPQITAFYGLLPAVAKGSLTTGENGRFDLAAQTQPVPVSAALATLNVKSPFAIVGEVQTNLKLTGAINKPVLNGVVVNTKATQVDRVVLNRLAAQFNLVDSTLTISQVQATPNFGGSLQGRGQIQLGKNSQVLFQGIGRNLPGDAIARLYGVKADIRVGTIQANAQIAGPANKLQTLVRFNAPQATYPTQGELVVAGPRTVVRNAQVQIAGGTVKADAQIVGGRWQAIGNARGVQLARLTSQVGGTVTGKFNVIGSLDSFKTETLIGIAQGQISTAGGTINAKRVEFGQGRWQALGTAQGVSLAQLAPNLPRQYQGAVSGAFNLTGSLSKFTPETLTGIAQGQMAIAGGTITANRVQLGQGRWQALGTTQGVNIGRLVPQVPPGLRGELTAAYNLSGSLTNLKAETVSGLAQGRLATAGGTVVIPKAQLANGNWQAIVGTKGINVSQLAAVPPAFRGRLEGAFELAGSLASFQPDTVRGQGEGRLQLAKGGQVVFRQGQLNNGNWQASLTAVNVPLEPLSPQLRGTISGQLQVAGGLKNLTPAGLAASGQVQLSQGLNQVNGPLTAAIAWNGRQLRINEASAPGLRADGVVTASFDRRGTPNLQEINLNLLLQDYNLAALPVKLPNNLQVAGRADFNGSIQGTLKSLGAAGQVALRDFAVNGVNFQPLSGQVAVTPGQGGTVQLAGTQDKIQLALSPNNFPTSFLVQRGDAIAQGRSVGEQILVDVQNFPIALAKNFIPNPQLAAQPVGGQVTGNLAVTLGRGNRLLADTSVVANNLTVKNPVFGTLKGDLLTAQFRYVNGAGVLENALFQQGDAKIALSGNFQTTPQGPIFQAAANINQGKIQDILPLLQIYELNDLAKGLNDRTYAKADALGQLNAVGTPQSPLQDQLRRLTEIQVLVARAQAERDASPIPELRELTGTFTGDVRIAGSPQKGITADFDFGGKNWQWGQYQADRVVAKGSFNQGILTLLPLRLESGESLVAFTGNVGGPEQTGQLRIRNLPIDRLQDYAALPIPVTGKLNATATLAGTVANPQATGELTLVDATLNDTPVRSAAGSFAYANARLDFGSNILVSREGQESLAITGSLPYQLPFASVAPNSNQLTARINVKDDGLALLNVLSRNAVSWVDGKGTVQIALTGTVDQSKGFQVTNLLADGNAVVDQATLRAQALPEPLTNVKARILFDFDQIRVEQAQGQFSGGQVVAQGVLPISGPANRPGVENPLTLALNNLTVNLKGLYNGDVNGTVTIAGSAFSPVLGGEVRLTDGQVLLGESPAGSAQNAGNPAAITPVVARPFVPGFNALQLTLGNNVQVARPPILNFLADGSLTINGNLEDIRPQGTIRLRRGQINLFTTQFRLERGYAQAAEFVPNQGLDPNLDVRLVATISEATQRRVASNPLGSEITEGINTGIGTLGTVRIQARVNGPASQLTDNLELTSNPSRSETEIVALLGGGFVDTLGRGDSTLGLANLAGSALLSPLQNVLGDALGLSEFRLFPTYITNTNNQNTTSTLGLAAEAGIDISPKVSASVVRVLTADQPTQFTLRYRVNENMLVRGSTDLSGDNRGVVEYERRF